MKIIRNKRNGKKIVALLLALLSLVGALSSCVSREEAAVPAGMKALTSDMQLDYTVFVPEEWTQNYAQGTVGAYVGYGDSSNVTVTSFALSREQYGISIEEFWKSYEEDLFSIGQDFAYDEGSPEAILLGGQPAMKYSYTATVTGIPCHFVQVVCLYHFNVTLLTYTAQEGAYARHLEEIDDILTHFLFHGVKSAEEEKAS